VPTTLEVDANARAVGNDRPAAVALARVLLARPWSAQILRIRVERAASHRVAGITLSGMKLKRRLAPPAFLREANAIADLALASDVQLEEVDLHVTVPLDVGVGTVTSGDYAHSATRTVFTLTVRRDEPRVREPYWNPGWRAGLR
jgi:hypothetical protein